MLSKEKSRNPFIYKGKRDYLPWHCLYLRPLPHAHALLVYIVHIVLSLLLLFQAFVGLVIFSTYSIYVTIVTMDI